MRRRQFLLTCLASFLATTAAAQEQKADADLDLGPVKGTEEQWYLLTAFDTLIFCSAIAVIKDPAVIVQARREIQGFHSSQLSDPKAEEAFNAALKSSDGQARVGQNKTAINDAAKEIEALLTDVVSPPIRAALSMRSPDHRHCSSPAPLPRTSRGGAMFTRFLESTVLSRNRDRVPQRAGRLGGGHSIVGVR